MNCPLLRIYFVILAFVVSTGCQSTATKLPELEAAPVPVMPIPAKTLAALLDGASLALDEDKLVFPEEGSAFAIYSNILEHYPGQNQALRGIENIVERYLVLANQALDQGRLASARSMLARARLVDNNHPGIASTHNRLERQDKTKRQVVRLNRSEIHNRSSQLSRQLLQLGKRASSINAQVVITAGSDAEGRWIYQQMKKGQGEGRIPAQLHIGSPAKVTLLVTKPTS